MSHSFPLTENSARSWLAAVDPRLKIAWVASLSLLSVLVDSTAALAGLFVLSAWPLMGLRLSLRGWLAIVGVVLATAWSTLLSQAIFYTFEPRTALFTIVPSFHLGAWETPAVRFYREGAEYGLLQSLRFTSLALAGVAVCLSTSPDRLLAGLVRLRVPVGIAFMTMTALRFLPAMLDEWATVRRARRLRGYRGAERFGPRDWLHAARGELQLLLPLLAAALRRAHSLAAAVSSRGFSPSAERTFYPELRLRTGEQAFLTLFFTLSAAVLFIKLLFWSAPSWLAAFPELQTRIVQLAGWL